MRLFRRYQSAVQREYEPAMRQLAKNVNSDSLKKAALAEAAGALEQPDGEDVPTSYNESGDNSSVAFAWYTHAIDSEKPAANRAAAA